MGEVVNLREEYVAKPFKVDTIYGEFNIAGTLCGCIDVALPVGKTLTLTPDEAQSLITALTNSREDVLTNSRSLTDHRLYEAGA